MDIRQINEVTSLIISANNHLKSLNEIGKLLADSRSDLNVAIQCEILGSAPPPHIIDPHARGNVANGGYIFGSAELYGREFFPAIEQKVEIRKSFQQDRLPNELALCMLDSMKAYWIAQKEAAETVLQDLMNLTVFDESDVDPEKN